MNNISGLSLYEKFLEYLFSTSEITVPTEFHDRCNKIREMLDDDVSGVINSLLDYSVNSASEAIFRVECTEPTLQRLLNMWLQGVNLDIPGIPTGLQALSKEYYKERWAGSSFCVLSIRGWETIEIDNVEIQVPQVMWYNNGSSIWVKRPKDKLYKLGTDEYYLDRELKHKIPQLGEKIAIQKPYDRWFDQYPTPYLVRKGILKNYLALKVLQGKSDEVISKVLPYLFVIEKGTENLFLKDVNYSDTELQEMVDNFKTEVEKYKNAKEKIPVTGVPFDQKFNHLIPDLRNVLSEELYRQGYRSILAGLGFIDLLEIAQSRQETRLNPKPFIAEINNGVSGFKDMLLDVIYKIIDQNKIKHPKFFSENSKITIVNNPLKVNTESILADIRSAYDRGIVSYKSYIGSLGFDYNTEKQLREQELENGDEDLFYPRIVVNREDVPDEKQIIKPKTNKEENLEDEGKEPNSPESNDFKNANKLMKCKKCGEEIDYLKEPEAGMGYIKCPKCKVAITQKEYDEAIDKKDLEEAPYTLDNVPTFIKKMTKKCQETFVATFNKVYKDTGGDEGKSFAIAYAAAKRCMKKQGYTYDKDKKTWEKK